MEFGEGGDGHERGQHRDPSVAMINVSFLLLIFFVLTASIAPRSPFPVALPESQTERPGEPGDTLFAAADGRLAWRGMSGPAVWPAIAAAAAEGREEITLSADADLPGAEVARLLARLGGAGIARVRLAVGAP